MDEVQFREMPSRAARSHRINIDLTFSISTIYAEAIFDYRRSPIAGHLSNKISRVVPFFSIVPFQSVAVCTSKWEFFIVNWDPSLYKHLTPSPEWSS